MSLSLQIFTIVKNGQPWISHHLPVFHDLTVPWHWVIAHGTSAAVHDTAWMAPQEPGLSTDGTTEFLAGLKNHPRVTVLERSIWDGKASQCNACLQAIEARGIKECLLLEVDSDELWTAQQLETLSGWFKEDSTVAAARFRCTFHVGMNIVTTTDDAYGNNPGEWLRAWRFKSGMRFVSHEPPNLAGNQGHILSRDETTAAGLVFDHFSYCTEAQLRFKETAYRYPNALAQWRRLQANTEWPVNRLKNFLPWVDDRATADLLIKP